MNYVRHRSYVVNEHELQLEPSDNLATYECHVANLMTTVPKKAQLQLRVNCE